MIILTYTSAKICRISKPANLRWNTNMNKKKIDLANKRQVKDISPGGIVSNTLVLEAEDVGSNTGTGRYIVAWMTT